MKKKVEEYLRQKEEKKLEEMFRDDGPTSQYVAWRNSQYNRKAAFGCLLMIGIAALTMLIGKCQGWPDHERPAQTLKRAP